MTEYEALMSDPNDLDEEIIFGNYDLTSIMLSSRFDDIIRKLDDIHRYLTRIFSNGKFRSNTVINNISTDIKSASALIYDLKKNYLIMNNDNMHIIRDKLVLITDMLYVLERNDYKEYKIAIRHMYIYLIIITIMFIMMMILLSVVYYIFVIVNTK